jgi:RNA polymerase sigma-70 factor (ECF subfamily)
LGTVTTYRDDTQTRAQPDERVLEAYRRELTGYCYRMLGSGFEADDAVQETMMRAWRGADGFEGRSALRSWLYRIATNVCIDMLKGPQRRAMPMDLGPSSTAAAVIPDALPEASWVLPIPDARVSPAGGDPAELTAYRESIRFAFVVALQHLPPRQRAILILREVLRWQASEVAELLDTTAVSVNSALQRARASLGAAGVSIDAGQPAGLDAGQQDLLNRYVDAFERYDVPEFVSLLRADATFSMPPHPMWLRGPAEVSGWLLGQGLGCRGSRLVATAANGCAAFGSYRPAGPGAHEPFAIQVIETSGGRISAIHNFLFPELFAAFGLPGRLQG